MLEDRSSLWEEFNKLPKLDESNAKNEKLLYDNMMRARSRHASTNVRIPIKNLSTSREHRRESVDLDWIICTDGVNVPEAKVTSCGQKTEMKPHICVNRGDTLPSCEQAQQTAVESHNVTASTSQETNQKPRLDWIIDTKPEHYVPYDEDEASPLEHLLNEAEDVEDEKLLNTALCSIRENTLVAETVQA
ncbi:unnamed protein product [Cylicocyclus nassatus]|uniref:Uncharacterized protein n=1 Tax=Cylicocyclus nassatus TaxID=53992 RepID=A0AA36GJ82_CYLNA|nr:unnamed protein product [Cylicocyclus nassatus]